MCENVENKNVSLVYVAKIQVVEVWKIYTEVMGCINHEWVVKALPVCDVHQ